MSTSRFTHTSDATNGYRASDFRNILLRLQKFEIIKEDKKRITEYIAYSQSLKSVRDLSGLHRLLDNILDAKLFPNIVIINQCIKKLSSLGLIDYARAMYRIATERKIANAITYASTIDAIGCNVSDYLVLNPSFYPAIS